MEFESLAEYETWTKDFQATPQMQSFGDRCYPLREAEAMVEILDLVE